MNKQVSTHRSDINYVCMQHVCTLTQSHYSIFILYHYNVLQLEAGNQNSHGGGGISATHRTNLVVVLVQERPNLRGGGGKFGVTGNDY